MTTALSGAPARSCVSRTPDAEPDAAPRPPPHPVPQPPTTTTPPPHTPHTPHTTTTNRTSNPFQVVLRGALVIKDYACQNSGAGWAALGLPAEQNVRVMKDGEVFIARPVRFSSKTRTGGCGWLGLRAGGEPTRRVRAIRHETKRERGRNGRSSRCLILRQGQSVGDGGNQDCKPDRCCTPALRQLCAPACSALRPCRRRCGHQEAGGNLPRQLGSNLRRLPRRHRHVSPAAAGAAACCCAAAAAAASPSPRRSPSLLPQPL